ncbi:NAD(P)-dependent oxidoreductase [Psychromarinibacter sp. C21-152]|uniref:NAD(P)-dependent oxidoreductase n=1 Tax=Psychromarinibacter sediminicola TaxID=3033385 RepID=A0AAE3NW44_9RHOB|nr:NAD(P)-dependent oxidoreductase [Psychromarinibacter sediminicola]MDF0601727.1 NAD(P)-dependent oxidoreductase [Psychromarinibacter sediminicola]
MSDTLGFVGLGRMGALMSKRLLDAGHRVVGCDVTPEAVAAFEANGGTAAADAAAVARQADVVFLSLPSPPIVGEVAAAIAGAGGTVRSVVDVSTTGPSVAKRAAAALGEQGIHWFDCPVSGGLKGAREGTLACMVSGPKADYERIDELLACFGKRFYVGDGAGLAQVAKLANNMLAAAAMVVSSEAMVMGVKAGIDPHVLLDIFNASTGRNSATEDKFPRSVLPGTFDFGFHTGLSYKDVRLCIDEAEAMGVPMIAGAVVRQILAATNAKYGPTSDFTSIVKITEDWAGVEVRG